MDLILTKNEYRSVQAVFDAYAVAEESGDAVVPDYCPDIIRIAETAAEFELTGKEVRGGRVFAEGKVHANAIYVPETGAGVYKIPVTIPVAQTFDISGLKDDYSAVSVRAELSGAAARELNPRKISVKATVTFRCIAYAEKELSVSCAVPGAEEYAVEYKKTALAGKYRSAFREKVVTLSDSAELNDIRANGSEILKLTCRPVITDYKLIPDKVILKGEMGVSMLVRTDDAARPVVSAETSFPFSGVLECAGAAEESILRQTCAVTGCEYKLSEEAGTGKTLLAMKSDISIYTEVWEPLNVDVISDAYSMDYKTELKTEELAMSGPGGELTVRTQVKESLPAGIGIRSVYACSVSAENASSQRSDEGTLACCDAKVRAIFEADDGGIYSLSKSIPVSFRPDEAAEFATLGATICDDSYHISGNEDLELRFTAEFTLDTGSEIAVSQLSGITLGDPVNTGRKPALTLCYADPGESLWSMAKRLRASRTEIAAANGISGDTPPEGRLLLVPRGPKGGLQ